MALNSLCFNHMRLLFVSHNGSAPCFICISNLYKDVESQQNVPFLSWTGAGEMGSPTSDCPQCTVFQKANQ